MRGLIIVFAILCVLFAAGAVQAQCPGPGCPYVVVPQYVVPMPVVVQPRVYAIPVQPYVYRQRYWTPLRDFLFGTHRVGYAPIY